MRELANFTEPSRRELRLTILRSILLAVLWSVLLVVLRVVVLPVHTAGGFMALVVTSIMRRLIVVVVRVVVVLIVLLIVVLATRKTGILIPLICSRSLWQTKFAAVLCQRHA